MLARPSTVHLVTVLAVATALRIPGLFVPSIWFDEAFAATFAQLGPLDCVIAALRFDVHPPLYYVQLGLWSAPSSSDPWLYANSVAFSLASIGALYLTAVRFFDARTAAIAAAFLALSPHDLLYAQSLRMYSLAMFLAILCWIVNHRLARGARGWRANLSVVACALLLSYSHALGFYMASFFGLYALLEARRFAAEPGGGDAGAPTGAPTGASTGAPTGAPLTLRRWLALYVPIGLMMLPAVGNALARSTKHSARPDLARILDDVAFFVLGTEGPATVPGRVAAVAALLALVLTAVRVRRSRPVILAVVVAPCVVMIATSYLYQPMWNRRSLAFVSPFLGLALALGLSSWRGAPGRRPWLPVSVAIAAVLLVSSVRHIVRWEKEQDFHAAAEAVKAHLPAGGTVFVPGFVDHWAVTRYFVGTEWGSPLAVQANARSERWDSILAKLGPERCEQLGLVPETTVVPSGPWDVVVGPIFDPSVITKRPVLVVYSDELPPEDLARLTMFEPLTTIEARGLVFGVLAEGD